MRKILTLKAGAAVAMAEFNVNPTPPLATYKLEAPPPATTNCNPQKCPWWPYSSSKDFKANTALIVIVLICALIIALAFNAAIRYIIRLHCSSRRDEEAGEGKAETGAAEAEVAAEIPWLIYSEEMEVRAECTICLSEFVVGERIRVLEKCGHGFHLQCIQKWLASHSSCPTCRANCVAMANQPGTVSVPT